MDAILQHPIIIIDEYGEDKVGVGGLMIVGFLSNTGLHQWRCLNNMQLTPYYSWPVTISVTLRCQVRLAPVCPIQLRDMRFHVYMFETNVTYGITDFNLCVCEG